MSETATEGLRTTLAELPAHAGTHLGFTPWREMTQEEVDRFAELTGDHNWIHVDPERAAQTPFGGTIAHGLFTLSIGPELTARVVSVEGFTMGLNYGYDRVRFPSPLRVGSRVRMRLELTALRDLDGGGVQATLRQTFEAEGADKPVCVADQLVRW